MVLKMVLDTYQFQRGDYGFDINFKLYEEDGSTQYNATGLTDSVIKCFKRHGDRAFFFRDVAKALTVIGQVAQVIQDITVEWDTIGSGEGHFKFTSSDRPTIPGYLWVEFVGKDSPQTKQISSELVRVYVYPGEVQ